MALEKFPDHPTNDELTRCRRLKRSGYECGANAVLSEIERIINENEDGCLALELIQLKIDELK